MTQEIKIIAAIFGVSLIILIGAVFFLSKSANSTAISVDPAVLVKADSHSKGSSEAKVVIVEFGDYQCPACKAFHPISKQIMEEYQNQVRFVFRNFPLSQHQHAQIAAATAEAASSQGKFWEMHDILYERQDDWASSSDPKQLFEDYAKELSLDLEKFSSEINENKHFEFINSDFKDGQNLGVSGTPTVFLNNKIISSPSYQNLKQAIEESL